MTSITPFCSKDNRNILSTPPGHERVNQPRNVNLYESLHQRKNYHDYVDDDKDDKSVYNADDDYDDWKW